jgi:hypothetical protein
MREYSGWQALFFSFWSPDFYRDVARSWKGTAYGYLLALLACTVFFYAVKVQLTVPPSYHAAMRPIYDQLPDFKFEKGIASINKRSPYQIYNLQMQPFIKYDMDNTEASPSVGDEAILITKLGKVTSKNVDPPFEISSLQTDFTLTARQVRTFFDGIADWIGVFIFLLVLPFNFVVCMVQSLIYALVGFLFSKLLNVALSYEALIRLSVAALTPTILLDSICNQADYAISFNAVAPSLSGLQIDLKAVFAVLLTLSYLFFAVYSCRKLRASNPLLSSEGKA